MKRNKMKKEILKVLKKWESCKMEIRTAEDVLSKIEEIGMLPPAVILKDNVTVYYEWEE